MTLYCPTPPWRPAPSVFDPLSTFVGRSKRVLSEYIGVARSALIPFLPPAYFTRWDIVICLRDLMGEGLEIFLEHLEAFRQLRVKGFGTQFAHIRAEEGDDEKSSNILTFVGEEAPCLELLSIHSPSPSILTYMHKGIDDDHEYITTMLWRTMPDEILSSPDWARRSISEIEKHYSSDKTSRTLHFVTNVLMREPEHVSKEDLKEYVGELMSIKEYRPYLGDYDSIRALADEHGLDGPAAPIFLREAGVELDDDDLIVRLKRKHLVDEAKVKRNLNYLIHLFYLAYDSQKLTGLSGGPSYHNKIWNQNMEMHYPSYGYGGFLYDFFIYHKDVAGTVPTKDQKAIMASILPQGNMSAEENATLCHYFGIDLGDILFDFLNRVDYLCSSWDMKVAGNHIREWMTILQSGEKGEDKGIRRKVGEGTWRPISPCRKFVLDLIEIGNEGGVPVEY